MRRRTLFLIAPEGWAVLTGLCVALGVSNATAGVWTALPWLGLIVLGVGYFRDTPRDVPAAPLAVIAPADAMVQECCHCDDPHLGRPAIKVTLRLDLFGAYLLRSPVEGTVIELAGRGYASTSGAVSRIRTDHRDELVVDVSDGLLFGARPCRSDHGARIGQGRCCGMRRLARTIDIYLPLNSRLAIQRGDRVRAGACVLAKLVHKHTPAAVMSAPGRLTAAGLGPNVLR